MAIISRGYGATADGDGIARNDEAMELEHRLPDVPHLQDRDRVRIAEVAIEELQPQCLVLDDGFQHRRLGRDLDIVLIDATNPFGYDRLLPRGLLREPIGSLSRADCVIVTRCQQVDDAAVDVIEKTIHAHSPAVPIARTVVVPTGLLSYSGKVQPIEMLAEGEWFAFCALGNPDAFFDSLRSIGCSLLGQRAFPDHHAFTREELSQLADDAVAAGATRLVCTHKDLVKVCVDRVGGLPVAALLIETQFVAGEQEIKDRISKLKFEMLPK